MTKLQLLMIEQSEKREALNKILQVEPEKRTDDDKAKMTELTNRLTEIEPELRAAITLQENQGDAARAAFNDDSESVELRNLIARSSMGDIFNAVLGNRAMAGETAELQQHFELAANQVPLAMLRGTPLEQRNVTPAPGNVGQNQAAVIPGVFPMSCAAFLGVDMPTVGVGEAVFPVLTTNADVKVPAEHADAADTTGSFSAEVLAPTRLQAAFFYSREDRARFAGMNESLRMNLSDALSDKLDQQILAGDEGLLHAANLTNHNVTAETSYANYRANLGYGRVDGTYAMTVGDLRIVMGSVTYAHASGVFRSDNAGDRAALEDLMAVTGGVKVSAHVPVAANSKQNCVIRLGMRRDMVAPIWEGITLIPDEVTKAKSGEIVVTAVMLHAVKILRSDGFYKQQTQHA